MTKIFISYRRADSQYVTDIVYEYMVRHFNKNNVFLDVGNIPFGVDFRHYLNEQIQAHDVVLVIIGPDWGRIMQERADQLNDFVRIEIESALQQGKLVIPVLVKNATMPDFSLLPASIQELQWRNHAIVRRQPDLENDCNRLAGGIRQYAQTVNVSANSQSEVVQTASTHPGSIDLMPPPFEWIEIPDKNYSIAKYPVTNAQFAQFIEVGGYNEPEWWTEAGWNEHTRKNWLEPRYWNSDKWNGKEHPVVGVSWYEAVAFCLWLSKSTGENIILPSEQQWQYAAQGNDDREYPWGNEWDGTRCNNSVKPYESKVTTPVQQYVAKGDSPFGVVDMAGNVWEWCLTGYKSKSNDISGTEGRVLRGGSWYDLYADDFRCNSRLGSLPNHWYYYWGFRLVRS